MHGQRAVLCAQPDIGSGGQVELCKTEVSKLDVATCIIEDVGWLPARTGTTCRQYSTWGLHATRRAGRDSKRALVTVCGHNWRLTDLDG